MPKTINKENFNAFEKTEKMGLVATLCEDGEPHISLLTTLMAADEKTMVVGQFSQGISKQNMLEREKSGFAIISLDMDMWTGLVNWKSMKTEGPEYVKYNNMQMWRFNTYFGIEKVYYGDLVEISDKSRLNLLGIGLNAVKVKLRKKAYKTKNKEPIMRPFAEKLFNGIGNPKFISFVNDKGYPVIVPVIQTQAASTDRIVFTAKPYADMLSGLQDGARVAVFCMSMKMESVLVKGVFHGFKKGFGYVDIDKIYNSMPPICGYTYPPEPYKEVTDF